MEKHDEQNHLEETHTPSISPTLIGWALAAVVASILMVTFNNSPMVLGAGFFMKLLAAIAGSVLGLIGALIGDAIRKFAHPDAVFTSGGIFSLIGTKLFWLLGPQTIGLLLVVAIGCALVLR